MSNFKNEIQDLMSNFIMTPRTLNDSNISDKALRIMLYFYEKPSGWDFNQSAIALKFKVSERTISRYISELKQSGFLRVEKYSVNGDFKYKYIATSPEITQLPHDKLGYDKSRYDKNGVSHESHNHNENSDFKILQSNIANDTKTRYDKNGVSYQSHNHNENHDLQSDEVLKSRYDKSRYDKYGVYSIDYIDEEDKKERKNFQNQIGDQNFNRILALIPDLNFEFANWVFNQIRTSIDLKTVANFPKYFSESYKQKNEMLQLSKKSQDKQIVQDPPEIDLSGYYDWLNSN